MWGMQDRTINNALQALRKQGGTEGKLAEVLLDMRGVGWTDWHVDRPMKKGEAKRLILSALRDGPKTAAELGKLVQEAVPGITKEAGYTRAYQSLCRFRTRGLVVKDFGPDRCLWRLVKG